MTNKKVNSGGNQLLNSGAGELDFGANRKLRSFVKKRVLNLDDADDILQLTYLEAWRNRHKFDGRARPETWLCGIAHNLIRNHFRRHYARPPHSSHDELETHEQPVEPSDLSIQFERHQLLDKTIEAIAELPRDMRETLWTAIETDGSYRDTAERLGVPVGTVRSRLSRAREQLKRSVHGEAS
ncbi:RNA polymerase sigma factor [Pseudomonas matsuisoli]|uniref:RNA polymerase sigma factor n=1 Tax=Pseudomonas matsuisoli TaxID=1515666 RepID=A0A917PHZ1_9PSED|nr:RNA polymerase sigma factor [Pseudomonas matsuisoli]